MTLVFLLCFGQDKAQGDTFQRLTQRTWSLHMHTYTHKYRMALSVPVSVGAPRNVRADVVGGIRPSRPWCVSLRVGDQHFTGIIPVTESVIWLDTTLGDTSLWLTQYYVLSAHARMHLHIACTGLSVRGVHGSYVGMQRHM